MKTCPLKKLALVALTLALSAGCAVGPRYSRPAAPAPTEYKETPPNWKLAQPADQVLRGDWWEIYCDPTLNELEAKVNIGNQTLKAAQAQFEQARAAIRYARASLYPNISVNPSATRERLSGNRPLGGLTGPVTTNDLILPVDMSYEPDVWGSVRSTVQNARATAQASFADLELVNLSVHAELAMDYFQARDLDAQAQLLDYTVAGYEKALQLTENRHTGGVASEVDVAQAQTQLETARAQDIDTRGQRKYYEHAIAMLIGLPASTFTFPEVPLNAQPPVLPPGLPSQLLERRPDIAGAERRIAAANANLGVARAAYFPVFNLFPDAGFEGDSITNWLTGPSGFAAVGISALETVFDAGKRRSISGQYRAAYNQAVANYEQSVLTAYQEVEDNLSALRILEQEAATQAAAIAAAQHSLQLSNNRYRGGVTNYLEVITAQNIALSDEVTGVQIAGRRMVDSVLLIKALGGGWGMASTIPIKTSAAAPPGSGNAGAAE